MINSAPQPHVLRLRAPAYLILGIAFLFPLIDLATNAWPMHPGLLTWRFGLVGVLSSSIAAPLLLLLMIYAFALSVGDRKVVIVCGVLAAIIAILLMTGGASFFLDMIQMKRRVPASQAARFATASTQALFKLAVNSLAALVLSLSIFRTLRLARVLPGEKEVRAGSVLVGMKPEKRLTTPAPGEPEVEPDGAEMPAPVARPVPAAAAASPAPAAPPAPTPSAGSELPSRLAPRSSARAPSVGMAPPPPPPRKPE